MFIFFMLFLFIYICIIVYRDNTNIKDILYVNMYDNNYIVRDSEYVYLLNSKYKELDKIDVKLIHVNDHGYEIIYKDDTLMYMDNYKNEEGIVFEYYDIYTYELIDEIMIGGN